MVSTAGHLLDSNGHIVFAGHPSFIEVQHVDPLSAVIAAENRDTTRNLRFIYLGVMIKKSPPSTHWKDARPWKVVLGMSGWVPSVRQLPIKKPSSCRAGFEVSASAPIGCVSATTLAGVDDLSGDMLRAK